MKQMFVKWEELSIEKSSIMGLFFGKYILATNKFNENFMLAFGHDRHYNKIVFINCNNNMQYVKIVDNLIEAEEMATNMAFALNEQQSNDVLNEFQFSKK